MPQYVLAADLGATNIRVAKVSSTGRISHRKQAPVPSAGGTAVIEALARLLRDIPEEGVRGIGVDVPGLAYGNGDVWAPNIRGWKRMPLGKLLRAQTAPAGHRGERSKRVCYGRSVEGSRP